MSKTFAFIKLDFRLIKPYTTSILLYLALGVVMGFAFKSGSLLSSFFMMSLMLIMSYPFTIGEKNALDTLYGTLSLNKRTVVIGRYFFVLILTVVFFALTFVSSTALNRIFKIDFDVVENLAMLCVLSGVFLIIAALQYPVYFKYGYTRARFLTLLPLFIIFLPIIQLPALARRFGWNFSWENIVTGIAGNPLLLCILPLMAGLIALTLSCALSCRIYAGREI